MIFTNIQWKENNYTGMVYFRPFDGDCYKGEWKMENEWFWKIFMKVQ